LCPPWEVIGTMKQKIEKVLEWSLLHAPALREKVCSNRSACAALATSNFTGAIKSDSNFLFFITAVADPTYAESYRCPTSAGPLLPFSDNAFQCKCPAGTTCQKGDLPCPTSYGHSHSEFSQSCTECKCISNDRDVGERVWPLVIPTAPHDAASDTQSRFSGTVLLQISGAIIALLLTSFSAVYCYRERCRNKTRRIATDMEFQEAFQTQQTLPVRV